MNLTTQQLTTLKAAILADPVAEPIWASGSLSGVADYYNAPASPSLWVWRTAVSRSEIYHGVSVDATSWNWTTYKAQNVSEQNAWVQMFMGDSVNFSLPNLRAGVGAIFGTGNAQTTHCLAIGRRTATRLEKRFATGTGSAAVPATMVVEGLLDWQQLIGL